jgi:peptidoglycan/LPS O-acetylase OafA/YrhL
MAVATRYDGYVASILEYLLDIMGLYRLLLAFLVVFSHIAPSVDGYSTGAAAVISFLLLSGFVMSALIRKYYLSVPSVPAFYLDRLIRLGPQFYLYTSATLLGVAFFRLHHSFMHYVPTLGATVAQFLVVPLNFYRSFPQMFLPQAWSLGLEAMFYAVFPFILIFRLRTVVALLSFGLFVIAQLGVVDTDLWAYRFLPGTLFIFICGSWLENPQSDRERRLPFILWGICALYFAATYVVSLPADRSVLLGFTVGVPMVYFLKQLGGRFRLSALAGDLSYGVFLNHNLVLGALVSYTSVRLTRLTTTREILVFVGVCAVSTVLSYITFKLVEQPLIARRRNLRTVKPSRVVESRPPFRGAIAQHIEEMPPDAEVITRPPTLRLEERHFL